MMIKKLKINMNLVYLVNNSKSLHYISLITSLQTTNQVSLSVLPLKLILF